jgi:hypothetical protein
VLAVVFSVQLFPQLFSSACSGEGVKILEVLGREPRGSRPRISAEIENFFYQPCGPLVSFVPFDHLLRAFENGPVPSGRLMMCMRQNRIRRVKQRCCPGLPISPRPEAVMKWIEGIAPH